MYHYISIRILYVCTSEHLAIPCATARHVCAWGMAACWTLIQERFPAEPKSGGPKGAKNIIQQAPPLEGTLLYNNRGVDNFKEWDGYYSMPIYLVIWFCVGFARFYGYWFSVPIRRWVMLSKSYPFGHGMNCGSQRIIWGNTKNE